MVAIAAGAPATPRKVPAGMIRFKAGKATAVPTTIRGIPSSTVFA